jgi:hypothetical protein
MLRTNRSTALGGRDLSFHAAAGVESDADADRKVVGLSQMKLSVFRRLPE